MVGDFGAGVFADKVKSLKWQGKEFDVWERAMPAIFSIQVLCLSRAWPAPTEKMFVQYVNAFFQGLRLQIVSTNSTGTISTVVAAG